PLPPLAPAADPLRPRPPSPQHTPAPTARHHHPPQRVILEQNTLNCHADHGPAPCPPPRDRPGPRRPMHDAGRTTRTTCHIPSNTARRPDMVEAHLTRGRPTHASPGH